MASILFQSSWTSIIFEGRNKHYGAYELRQSYEKNMLIGLLIMCMALSAVTFCTVWLHHFPKNLTEVGPQEKETVVIFEIDKNIYSAQKHEIVKPTLAKRTSNPFVPTEEKNLAETIKPLNVTETGSDDKIITDNNGNNNTGTLSIDGSPGSVVSPSLPDITPGNEIPSFAETMPVFEGSIQKYIAANFNYPEEAVMKGIDGKILVEIILDERGKVISARVLKSLGYGCDEEAIRTVLAMPEWKPAMHGNRPVKIRLNIPIKLKLG